MRGTIDIAAERRRQIAEEGRTAKHDDQHDRDELAFAAIAYAAPELLRSFFEGNDVRIWPWGDYLLKVGDRRRDLVKAGALIAAEIDRLDRLAGRDAEGDGPAGPVELYALTITGEQLDQLQDFLALLMAGRIDPSRRRRAEAFLELTMSESHPVDAGAAK